MKIYIPVACAAILLLASCQEDNLQLSSENGPIAVSIDAEMGEFDPSTKSTAESCIRMKWASGDKVFAYGSNGSSIACLSASALTVSLVDGDPYKVTISGTLSSAPSDETLFLLHSPLCGSTAPSISNGKVSIEMKTQKADVIPFVAYAKVTNVSAKTVPSSAKFNFASSVIKVNVTSLDNSMNLSGASATINDCNTKCEVAFGSTITVGSAGKSSTASANVITKTLSGTTSATGKTDFYIAVPKQTAGGAKTITVKPSSGTDKYERTIAALSAEIAANKYINTICDCAKLIIYPESGTYGTYVSETGCVWAPVNCGYNATDYKCGKLYQFGRKDGCGYYSSTSTIPASDAQNKVIQSLKDLGGNVSYTISSPSSTLFYRNPNEATMDWYTSGLNKQFSEWSADRSGTVNANPCPEGWRVPTQDELGKLCYTDWNSKTHSGSTKRLTSSNWDSSRGGVTILGVFFPAAGYRNYGGGGVVSRGSNGRYWSSSVYDVLARNMDTHNNGGGMTSGPRAYGFSVRCVQDNN